MTKFTDEQIINIFKHCDKSDCIDDCRNCAAHQDGECAIPDLGAQVVQVTVRQKAEIENLKAKIAEHKAMLEAIDNEIFPLPFETDFDKSIKTAKIEAMKEFVEKLTDKISVYSKYVDVDGIVILNRIFRMIEDIEKEMTEVEQ